MNFDEQTDNETATITTDLIQCFFRSLTLAEVMKPQP
jgi:hypothetical protein